MIFCRSVVHSDATTKQTTGSHSLSFWNCTCAGDLDHNIRSLIPKLLFWKDKEWLAVGTAMMASRPLFAVKVFEKGVYHAWDEKLGRVYHAKFFAWYANALVFIFLLTF